MPTAEIALPSLPKLIDKQDDLWPALWRGCVSEFFATMIFVFIGTGAVVACQEQLGSLKIGVPSLTLISLAHGFAIMVLVYAVGEISGGHINPAVTWACFFTGKISVLRAVAYVLFQLFGAIVGSSLLKSVLPPSTRHGMGCHELNPLLTPAQGFEAEIIFTFIFIFVVFATAISPFAGKMTPLSTGEGGKTYGPGKLTPFAVGMAILMLHTVGIPFTGASMNPARSFGPAVVNGCWANHWIYWLGPWIGSTVAAVVAQIVFLSTPRDIFRLNKNTLKDISTTIMFSPQSMHEVDLTASISPPIQKPTSPPVPQKRVAANPKPNPVSESTTEVPKSPKPQTQQPQQPQQDMHKSGSGQFSAIMQEDSDAVVELEEFN